MLNRIHDRLGTVGLVVAVVALVAALAGTAFAALPGLNSKQKKQVTKIAKKFAGRDGAPGAQGPVGPAGPAGARGADGTDGTDGVSPVGTSFSGAKGGCTEGGIEFTGANTTFACNGKPGPTETKLPSGKTETGTWMFQVDDQAEGYFNISYPLRVIPTPEEVVYVGVGEPSNEQCPGSATEPKAAAKTLCIYATALSAASSAFPTFVPGYDPTSGLIAYFEITEEKPAFGYGTWAVTAP